MRSRYCKNVTKKRSKPALRSAEREDRNHANGCQRSYSQQSENLTDCACLIMATKRAGLTKGRRFEVFKRDGFTCQYCGAHPPSAVLHVDHIVAVANGGTSDDDNLITSCSTCNLGKSARLLDVVPESLKAKALRIAEQEAQLLGYQGIMEAKRNRLESECWRVIHELFPGKDSISRDKFSSIKMFVERLGLDSVLEAAEIAYRSGWRGDQLFRYFCGVCWKRIKGDVW